MNPATDLGDKTAEDAGYDSADDEQDARAQDVGDCSEKARHAGGDVHRSSFSKATALSTAVMILGSLGEERVGDARISV
jgi:hypothetical protein